MTIAQWVIWTAVTGAAIFLTLRYNKTDPAHWKLIKLLGIAISTVPILGMIQGAIAFRKNAVGYGIACFLQAMVGVVAYTLLKYT